MMKEQTIDIKAAAAHLSLTEEAVQELVQKGTIPATKEGEKLKFKKSSLHDVLNYQIKSFKKEELRDLETNQEKKIIEIYKLLRPEHMILNLITNTKSKILAELVNVFAKSKNKEKKDILLKAVRDREKLCTTAITEGVAIPHPRHAIKNLVKKPFIIFGRSKIGVDFESIDGHLTKLFFLVCAPRDDLHLKIMARLSRLLRTYEFRKELLGAAEKDQVIEIVKKYEQQDII